MEEQVKAARDLMGADFWPYGIPANRKTLEYFLAQHHSQGLSSRLVSVAELFHPTTFEAFKI
jgi:4,5-dihydroxyphthalate decarboxylase